MRHMFYGPKGTAITAEQWASMEKTQLHTTTIESYKVVTKWKGIDQGYGLGIRPLIFETRVSFLRSATVPADKHGLDGFRYWYVSEEDAAEGHDRIVNMLRAVVGE